MTQIEYERVTNLNHLRAAADNLDAVIADKQHGVSEVGLRRAVLATQQLIDKLAALVEKDIQG